MFGLPGTRYCNPDWRPIRREVVGSMLREVVGGVASLPSSVPPARRSPLAYGRAPWPSRTLPVGRC
jgi:hypothetical protein